MNRRSGITLLELLIVMAMTAMILIAVARAFSSSIGFDQRIQDSRDKTETARLWQEKVADLIRGARVSASAANGTSFFIGQSGNLTPDAALGGGLTSGGTGSMALPGGTADTLIFDTPGEPVPQSTLSSTDDFETQNQNVGPQGGIEEVQIGMAAVGDAGGKTGLFLREERPADGDPSQGGQEVLLTPEVATIQFEFWDGLTWQTSWDSRSMTPTRRIPAAVRVTYTLTGDAPGTNHAFVVSLPNSDVTATNPVTQTTVGAPTGGG